MNSLPKTVTRQRRGCNLNPGRTAPESSTLTTRLPGHPLLVVLDDIYASPITPVRSQSDSEKRYQAASAGRSLKKRRTKSPSSLGSKVDGTMTYFPGVSLCRSQTSRRLLNAVDLADDVCVWKNRASSVPLLLAGAWKTHHNHHHYDFIIMVYGICFLSCIFSLASVK